ncbi:MAG: hypothetical protein J0H88_16245 [Sphingomonadales bacterium]|nr:hypothetical protein [Sphingomonadales bacterium]
MAYVIVEQPRAWWPIRFNGVTEEGEIVENEVRGRFIILDEDEFKEFEDDMMAVLVTDKPVTKKVSQLLSPFIMRILENWEHVLEDDGTKQGRSLPFDEPNLQRMLRVPNFAAAVAAACREVRKAEPVRRTGN